MMPRFADENFPKNLEVVDKFRAVAARYGVTPSQITLAWILAEHPDFVPVPGTRNAGRLEENASAAEIVLKDEDVRALRDIVDTGRTYARTVRSPDDLGLYSAERVAR